MFEGMAVGLEESVDDVWTLFFAISFHKWIIVFCICMELQQSGTKNLIFFSYLTVFSFISPLGIGVGTAIFEAGDSGVNELTVSTLQGIAGGTILYVVMFEVLNRERVKDVPGLLQLFGIILGFCIMLLLEIFRKYLLYLLPSKLMLHFSPS